MECEKKIMAMRIGLNCKGSTIEFPANPCAIYPEVERLNCFSVNLADGSQFTINNGPTRVSASVSFKCVSYEFAKEYEDFLLNKIEMGIQSFNMYCPAYFDLGKGKGASIYPAYYNGPASLGRIIKPSGSNGMFYDLELPYMFVRDYEP
jgi:hypothetical protein